MKKILVMLISLSSVLPLLAQQWDWSNQFKSDGNVYPSSNIVMDIQVDDNNNVYHCGGYEDFEMTVQGTTIASDGSRWDAFISKFDETGTLQWINRISSNHNDEAAAMAIIDNYIFVVGNYKNEDITFPPSAVTLTNTGDYDSYLAKYDLDGNFINAKRVFWGTSVNRVKAMTYDPYRDELIMTGFFKVDMNYTSGGVPQTTLVGASGKDMFIAQVDTSGEVNNFAHAWTKDPNNNTVIKDINMSADSSYYLSGDLLDTLFTATDDTLVGNDNSAALLMKYDKNLELDWFRTAGGAGSDHANSAASDDDGLVYLAGKIESTVTFDSTETLKSSAIDGFGAQDLFLAKYNTNGRLLWVKRKGSIGNDDAFGISVSENLVQFCGNFEDTLIINADTLASPAGISTSFAMFDLEGNEVGAQGIGGDGEDVGRAVCFDLDGSSILAGYFTSSTIQIGDSTYTNTAVGVRDGFIATYDYAFKVTLEQEAENSCYGDTNATVNVTTYFGVGPYNYEWSPTVDDFDGSTAENLGAGEYTLTVTDSRSQVAVANITIGEPDELTLGLNASDLNCYQSGDGQVIPIVDGGTGEDYTFLWTGNVSNPTDSIQSNLGIGWYKLEAFDENLCSVIDSVELTQPNKIMSTAIVGEESPGMSDGSIDVDVVGGTQPYNYSWEYEGSAYPGDTDVLSGLEEGEYIAYVTDDNSCTYDTNIVVPGTSLRVALNGTNIACYGAENGSLEAIIVSGDDPSETYTYEFQDSEKNTLTSGESSTLDNLIPGKYYVVLTEQGTLETSIDSVELSQPDSLEIAFAGTNAKCFGDNTSIGAAITGGTADYSYLWSNTETTQSLSGVPAGWYKLTVTDANGCVTIDSTETIQPGELSVSITVTNNITCYGLNNGRLDASVTGGTGIYSYLWNDENEQATSFAEHLDFGTYAVTVTDENNCTATAQEGITEPPLLQLTSMDTAHVSCTGGSDGHFGITMEGGTPPYSYAWNPLVASTSESYADNLDAESYAYKVEVTDANNCGNETTMYTFLVREPEAALSVTGIDTVNNLCNGDVNGSIQVSASGGWDGYEYSINKIDWGTNTFSDLAANTYTVTVRDAEGCEAETTIPVTEPDEITINTNVIGNTIVALAAGGSGDLRYSLDGTEWQDGGTFEALASGDYTVYVTDENDCGPVASNLLTVQGSSIDALSYSTNSVYPNPSRGVFNLDIASEFGYEFKIEILSIAGVKVYEETKYIEGGASIVELNLTDSDKGIYILQLNGVVLDTKLIIQ